jgi:hypothetical protein
VLGPYKVVCWRHTQWSAGTVERRCDETIEGVLGTFIAGVLKPYIAGVLGPYIAVCCDRTEREWWDRSRRCVGTIQWCVGTAQRGCVGTAHSALGTYRPVCWDCTVRVLETYTEGVLGP